MQKNKTNNIKQSFTPSHYTAYDAARELMVEENITSLPVDPYSIARNLGVDLIAFDDPQNGLPPKRIQKLRSLKIDAILIKPDPEIETYWIFYDNQILQDRQRFTIAHELGHIRLGHKNADSLMRKQFNREKDPVEIEADDFAGELLRPPALMALTNVENVNEIQCICWVSSSSAENGAKRIRNIKHRIAAKKDKIVLFYKKQFYNFINQKYCLDCQSLFISENAKFCPTCGCNKIKWANRRQSIFKFVEEPPMIYPSHRLNAQTSKAIICPVCDNEGINPEGNYCHICGTYLINECVGYTNEHGNWIEGCGNKEIGSSRYCSICGNPTSFYRDNVLLPWQDERKIMEYSNVDEEEIPF